jgi:diacylglycerol kinase family enzyme
MSTTRLHLTEPQPSTHLPALTGTRRRVRSIAPALDAPDSRVAAALSRLGGRGHPRIAIDGEAWFRGKAGCILVGNVGHLFGGVEVFDRARPDDGRPDIGVVTADGVVQWARTLARTAAGDPARSPFVRVTSGRAIDVELDRKVLYELDGGDRTKAKKLKVRVEPEDLTVCVPRTA